MALADIVIPKGKRLIAKSELEPRKIISPDGTELSIYAPQNREELERAWQVLIEYTKRNAPNPEGALQDLDDISDVAGYYFSRLSYVAFTAVDNNKNPVAIAPSQIVSLSDMAKKYPEAKGRGMGFIYQIGHNEQVSLNDTDFSVATQLYEQVSNLLLDISKYKDDNWLGVVTESRKEGPELEAILNAGFDVTVPNKFYRPLAVQNEQIKDKNNLTTDDLVLLARGMPKDPKLQLMAAETYVRFAYCKGQNIRPALKLIHNYFANK